MTGAELIKALSDDLCTTRSKAEDILNAIADLCAETLKNGGSFTLGGGIGRLMSWKRGEETAIKFEASPGFRDRLGLADKYGVNGAPCRTCHNKPRAPRRADCYACRRAAARAKKKKVRG